MDSYYMLNLTLLDDILRNNTFLSQVYPLQHLCLHLPLVLFNKLLVHGQALSCGFSFLTSWVNMMDKYMLLAWQHPAFLPGIED